MNTHTHDIIALKDLRVTCLVGIHPHERITPQPLVVQIKLYFPRKPGSFGKTLAESLDYSFACGDVAFLLEAAHFQLLETAVEAICATLLMPPPPDRPCIRPEAVEVSIQKPQALAGKSVPVVTVMRKADEMQYGVEHNDFGRVDILHENQDCGVYLLHIPAAGQIPAHIHKVMGEAELIMSRGLLLQGEAVDGGIAHFWPLEFIHQYDNPSQETRTILCVNRPKFDPADEIKVEQPQAWPDPRPHRKRFFGLEQNLKP
ncbi:MAG: dihydroneopterin aldolase [Flavobacteriales bacterium]